MKFQIIKINRLDKAVLIKTGFGVLLKFGDILVQPDGLSKVESVTDLLQGMEYLVGAGVLCLVLHNRVTQHMVLLKNFCPDAQYSQPPEKSYISFNIFHLTRKFKKI